MKKIGIIALNLVLLLGIVGLFYYDSMDVNAVEEDFYSVVMNEVKIELGQEIDPFDYIKLNNLALTTSQQDNVQIEHNIDTSMLGNYTITYTVEDFKRSVRVKVVDLEVPVIHYIRDYSVYYGTEFEDIKDYIYFEVEDNETSREDLVASITIEGYNPTVYGLQEVSFIIYDLSGNASLPYTVNVHVI